MDDVRFAEMISKIAHELRSPLTSVKGFSSTLVSRWDRFTDEQRKQFVETIHADAERMARIVSEVLDLARLEANRLELNPNQVQLRALVEKVAASHSELPGATRISIEVDEEAIVWADPERLTHVLSNLIENAIKFSDDGPIEVSTERTSQGAVTIKVSDQGVGIDPETLPHIFEGPAAAAQKATPSGSGLGLYLSRRLVEAHGGTLEAESTAGAGAIFSVTLPPGTAPVEP